MKLSALWLLLSIVMICFLILSCDSGDDDDDSASEQGDDDDDSDLDEIIENLNVNWEPCSLYEGAGDGRAMCSYTEMPFDWLGPDQRSFTAAAKFLPSDEPATAQIWLLHGGPGASGFIGYPSNMEYLHNNVPGLDVYTLDLRGTGYSEYLECPDQESPSSQAGSSLTSGETEDCALYLAEKWGDDLNAFSTTQGAYDLGAFIFHTKAQGLRNFVYGASGGAYWALRYLQVFPEQSDGVIIEGIAPPGSSLVFQDEYADKVVRRIFELCEQDSSCSANLPDPEQALYALYDKLDSGHCAEFGLTSHYLRVFFDQLAYYYPWYTTIPSIVFRLDRCNEEDKAALGKFWNQVWGAGKKSNPTTADRFFSEPLFYTQVSSELWEHRFFEDNDALVAYLDGVYENSLIGYNKGYTRNNIHNFWPKYSNPLDDLWPQTATPLLMMNGELDPSTPIDFAREVQDHFTGAHQNFYEFAYGAHGVTGTSPYMTEGGEIADCANEMYMAFLEDPMAKPDSHCVEKNLKPDFTGQDFAQYFYGTADYWGNDKALPLKGANQSKFQDELTFEVHLEEMRHNLHRAFAMEYEEE